MSSSHVFDAMTEHYNTLTRSGRKVADYIYANKHEAQYMSITALAEECGVAEATIFRFCQSLGYSGYNEFKLGLAKASGGVSFSDENMGAYEKITPEDSLIDLCKKLYTVNVSALGETLAQVDDDAVARAVQYFSDAHRVYCFGQGGSLVMAMEAWARFATVAPQFQYIEDSHMQAMAASLAAPSDVILFFSYSGATKDMLDAIKPARARGAKIVLVTHFKKSPAAALADVILLCGSKEGPLQSGSVAAKMALLFIIDILFHEYCRKNEEFTNSNRETTAAAIATKLL